jgi:hypothetical protein
MYGTRLNYVGLGWITTWRVKDGVGKEVACVFRTWYDEIRGVPPKDRIQDAVLCNTETGLNKTCPCWCLGGITIG